MTYRRKHFFVSSRIFTRLRHGVLRHVLSAFYPRTQETYGFHSKFVNFFMRATRVLLRQIKCLFYIDLFSNIFTPKCVPSTERSTLRERLLIDIFPLEGTLIAPLMEESVARDD